MIASLPMYARASNRAAHDALWALIRDGLRARGLDAPDALDHEIDHFESWGCGDLVLGQICNLPLRKLFMDKVTIIGCADYGLDGCNAGDYRSHFIVHRDCPASSAREMIDSRFVYNDMMSQSGYGAAQIWAQQRGQQFNGVMKTGSHRASISAIAEGHGDIAAIDAQTWWIECLENSQTDAVRIIGHTDPSPGMTFTTRKGENPQPYFAAIEAAIKALPAQAASILGLKGIILRRPDDYTLPFPPEPAVIAT